jgi:hypothetical protein
MELDRESHFAHVGDERVQMVEARQRGERELRLVPSQHPE